MNAKAIVGFGALAVAGYLIIKSASGEPLLPMAVSGDSGYVSASGTPTPTYNLSFPDASSAFGNSSVPQTQTTEVAVASGGTKKSSRSIAQKAVLNSSYGGFTNAQTGTYTLTNTSGQVVGGYSPTQNASLTKEGVAREGASKLLTGTKKNLNSTSA